MAHAARSSFGLAALLLLAATGPAVPSILPRVQAKPPSADLEAFLDRAAERFKTLDELKNCSLRVVAVRTEMDRNWAPATVTKVTKSVVFTEGVEESTILEALETKDGRTRDITRETAEENLKSLERARKRRAEESARPPSGRRRSGGMDLDEIIPFSAKKRPEYTFTRIEAASGDGAPALALDFSPKVKDDEHWAGRLWFDPDTADLRRAEIRFAETPAMVKEMEIVLSFTTLPSGPIAVKSIRVRVNAGFFLKRVREVVEEAYSDYVVRD